MNQEKVWDAISESWHGFRQKSFQPVSGFKQKYKLKKGKILEIGCGNARNLVPFAEDDFECFGIDFSEKMLTKAKLYIKKHNMKVSLLKADMTKLPYKEGYFDYVLHVASLHHLDSEDKIMRSLMEAKRVLKMNGLMLLTVWNKLQLKFLARPRDLFIPWSVGGKKYKRFYHLFDYVELRKLIKKVDFKVLESNIFGKNLVFVLKKK